MLALTATRTVNDRYNQASILSVRSALTALGCSTRADQDNAINAARRAGLIFLEQAESKLTPEHDAACIREGEQRMAYVGIRLDS